jgi:D-alanyl-D-alanine carboxypeptidase/D-alanyl-D-alanine-endopeptidase (penicillin-binding protein 4)
MLKKPTLLLLFFLNGIIAIAQSPVQKLEQAFNELSNDPQAAYALTSLCVLDANTGKQLFGRNENIGLATASTLKTITSATAFGLLGKDFQYQTTLAYSGKIAADGTLNGDILLIGGGDPTLASWRYEKTKEGVVLNQLVKAIQQAGIKRIQGSVIGDDRAWGTQTTPEGWTWQSMGNYYGAGPSALTWRENQYDIHLRAQESGSQPVSIVKTVPEMPYVTIVNELKAGARGTGDNAYGFSAPYTNILYLRGSWGLGYAKSGISVSLPDPAFEAAYRLQDTLKRVGIPALKPANTMRQLVLDGQSAPAVTQKLATLSSPSLSEIVYWFNKKSVNLYGEHLLKTFAWKAGKEATTQNGADIEIKYWAAKGFDKNALNIVDGSGLSPATRVTTSAMARILFQVQKESWFADFYNSLPENNGMALKSGSISDVSAYAGYYTAGNGAKYVIVININNYSGSGINRKLFKVLDALK